jgi:hypothetical protein
MVNTVHALTDRGIGLKIFSSEGAAIDTTTASGKLVFGISPPWLRSSGRSSPSARSPGCPRREHAGGRAGVRSR